MISIRGKFGMTYEAVSGLRQLSREPRCGWEEVVVIADIVLGRTGKEREIARLAH